MKKNSKESRFNEILVDLEEVQHQCSTCRGPMLKEINPESGVGKWATALGYLYCKECDLYRLMTKE